MQRQSAKHRFNAEPVTCHLCNQLNPNYRMLITHQNQLRCVTCASKNQSNIMDIKMPYKEYYHNLIKKLPIPDYKIAQTCLETVLTLKEQTNDTLTQIRNKLDVFENDLKQFFQQTVFICQGYIDKLKQIQEIPINKWLHQPPKFIDQDKFIFNIKQKQHLAYKIQDSLKELQFNLPSIQDVKKQAMKYTNKLVCKKVCITAAVNIRGVLFMGTNDGRIILDNSFQTQEIKAHDSLIRDFQHDGQFKLYSSSDDQIIKIWDIRGEQPKLIQSFGSLQGVRSSHRELAIIDSGKCLASSRGQFDQYKIRIWDLNNYNNSKTLPGHDGYLKGMLVTDQNQLVTVAEDRYLKIWDLKTCESYAELYHSCKINYLFHNNQSSLLCIIDEGNRIFLLDFDSLSIFTAIWAGKKIQYAQAQSCIYIYTDRYLNIYNWNLALIQKLDLSFPYIPTNIIESVNKLIITDAGGNLHEIIPSCLKLANS